MASNNTPAKLELKGISKQYGNGNSKVTAVESADLQINPGEFVTVLGPSGCGKTTILRMIAGFESPSSGSILLDDKDITSTPPNKRPMSLVFQSYALFPHLTVKDNVGFGLKIHKVPRDEYEKRVEEVMRAMDISEYAERAPHALSGGQQQRVALARAIVMEPRVLLFDEPLSNLDARLRDSMRLEIRNIQRKFGITSVFVTHDQDEAMTMSDKIVVMSRGRIEQVGSPQEIYRYPNSYFVADFLGSANFLDVEVKAVDKGEPPLALVKFDSAQGRVPCAADLAGSGTGKLVIRAEDFQLSPIDVPVEADTLCIPGKIVDAVFYGESIRYQVQITETINITMMTLASTGRYELNQEVNCVLRDNCGWVIR